MAAGPPVSARGGVGAAGADCVLTYNGHRLPPPSDAPDGSGSPGSVKGLPVDETISTCMRFAL